MKQIFFTQGRRAWRTGVLQLHIDSPDLVTKSNLANLTGGADSMRLGGDFGRQKIAPFNIVTNYG